jgi:hypothetical protein
MSKRAKDREASSTQDQELVDLTLEDLARSGLDKGDYKKLRLEPLSRSQTDEYVGEDRSSYKIPYFDLEGRVISYARVRFLESAKRKKFNSSGKFKSGNGSFRYSQPFNSTPHVYFPPYFNWKKIAVDVSQKILITEGEKKAAAACKMGIPCIALGGVYGFKSAKRNWEMIPELQLIDWKKRQVEICYDADVMLKAEVRQALGALSFTLSQQYGPESIDFIFLDAEVAGAKTGLDDYLIEKGKDGFESLVRQPYRASAKIQLLNQKLCYVQRHARFYDIEHDVFFKSFHHVRDTYMNEGEEIIDGKRTALVIDLWGKSSSRRAVLDVVYQPGVDEVTERNELNLWRPSEIQPKKGKPRKWLEIVHHIFRNAEHAEFFLKWLAYPVQNPGAKLFQSVFVYSEKQGTGKTLCVDPVMEFVYGAHNFHRLSNKDLIGKFNGYAKGKCFIATNEVYLPDYADRRAAMGELKEMITREKVNVNIKFAPEQSFTDHCNYYLTSQHMDALALEKSDRRFFVVEGPNEKLPQSTYDEFDEWVRGEGSSVILHYLRNSVDCSDFNPKADAPMTSWKRQIINLSRDPFGEFVERIMEDPEMLFIVNGELPSLQLFRAEDILKLFEHTYPKYRFNVTVDRMGKALRDPRIERRKVRLSNDSPLRKLYCLFDREAWRGRRNKDWAEHYKQQAKLFGGKSRMK